LKCGSRHGHGAGAIDGHVAGGRTVTIEDTRHRVCGVHGHIESWRGNGGSDGKERGSVFDPGDWRSRASRARAPVSVFPGAASGSAGPLSLRVPICKPGRSFASRESQNQATHDPTGLQKSHKSWKNADWLWISNPVGKISQGADGLGDAASDHIRSQWPKLNKHFDYNLQASYQK